MIFPATSIYRWCFLTKPSVFRWISNLPPFIADQPVIPQELRRCGSASLPTTRSVKTGVFTGLCELESHKAMGYPLTTGMSSRTACTILYAYHNYIYTLYIIIYIYIIYIHYIYHIYIHHIYRCIYIYNYIYIYVFFYHIYRCIYIIIYICFYHIYRCIYIIIYICFCHIYIVIYI